ncbi:hypothetical protein HEL22_022350 [Escherichia sp. 14.0993]|nr:hypothetical protein [Escherichia sp. 14.0993]
MTRLDYDFINLSLEHEMNEWLAERGYVGQADIRTDSNQLFLFDSLEGMLFRAEAAYAAGGCDLPCWT